MIFYFLPPTFENKEQKLKIIRWAKTVDDRGEACRIFAFFPESLAAATKNDVTLHNFLYLRLQASLKHFVRLKWARKVWQIRGHKIQQKSRTQRQIRKIHFKLSIKMMASMKRFSNYPQFCPFLYIFFHLFRFSIFPFFLFPYIHLHILLRIADNLLRICWEFTENCW